MSRPAHRRAVGLFPFALTLAMATGAQEPVGESYEGNATAIVDVTIIDPATETVRPGQVVVTRYGKIESIKPAADFRAPGWMTTLNGRGRYLIPGLWDAHVHLSFWWEPEGEATASTPPPAPDAYREVLGRLASWGVTSVRDMGGDLDAQRATTRGRGRGSMPWSSPGPAPSLPSSTATRSSVARSASTPAPRAARDSAAWCG